MMFNPSSELGMTRTANRPSQSIRNHTVSSRTCPSCGGCDTRLVRKTLHHPSRRPSADIVCDSCKFFWQEGPKAGER